MSRRKHQSVKMLKDKRAAEKYSIAQYGEGVEAQVFELVRFWDALFMTHPDLGNLPPEILDNFSQRHWLHTKQGCPIAPMNPGDQTRLLVGKLRQAMAKGDASFFRDLANAIERFRKSPIDLARSWLTSRFYLELASQDGGPVAKGWENTFVEVQPKTAVDLLEEMNQAGIRIDERQLRRMCKELGITLAKGKRGRPKIPAP